MDNAGLIEEGEVDDPSLLTPETTLEEEDSGVEETEVFPPRSRQKNAIQFPCTECGLSFNLKIRLNRHLKLHSNKKSKSPKIMRVCLQPFLNGLNGENGLKTTFFLQMTSSQISTQN